jgi:hypothetical protein
LLHLDPVKMRATLLNLGRNLPSEADEEKIFL